MYMKSKSSLPTAPRTKGLRLDQIRLDQIRLAVICMWKQRAACLLRQGATGFVEIWLAVICTWKHDFKRMDSKTDTHIKTLIINFKALCTSPSVIIRQNTSAYNSILTSAYEKRCRGSGEASGRSCVAGLLLHIAYKAIYSSYSPPPILFRLDDFESLHSVCI